MKVAPVSADLLVRLALVAAGVGLAYYLYRRTFGAAQEAAQWARDGLDAAGEKVSEVADAVIVGTNPMNPENWVNRGVTAAGDLIVSSEGVGRNADGSWTLGGAVFDMLNPGWSDNLSGPVSAVPTPVMGAPTDGAGAFSIRGWNPELNRPQNPITTIARRGRVVGGL